MSLSRDVRAGTSLRIVAVFPELLGTYGDGGNVVILNQRARWRGISTEVVSVTVADPIPATGDIYVIGGGEDGAQVAAMAALRRSGRRGAALRSAHGAGAQILAVCAGFQMLGESFTNFDGVVTDGLGLLDVRTTRLRRRAVGELLAAPAPELGIPTLSGFENHGGHTEIGPAAQPLATVIRGIGNGPGPGRPAEGAIAGGIVATYLHGPVLARNETLADVLIARATGVEVSELAPLQIREHAGLRAQLRLQR
jgi:CobQ-like glutamine amidotransferase family enzyme